MKVLLADDDPLIMETLETVFKANGFEVIKCSNGLTAMETARVHNPDLIIIDIMMPKLNGWEVCNSLKQDETFRRTPLVILTAKTAQSDEFKGLECGADLYLKKPFNPLEVFQQARKLLGK